MALIEELVKEGWLKTPRIITAFKKIKRKDFMPKDAENLAELNNALPIGFGQTISQPLVVAFMLEQLQPEPGDKILDIGFGSGWTTALLAHIVSQKGNSKLQIPKDKQISNSNKQNSKLKDLNGKILAIEIILELKKIGEQNVAKYNFMEKRIVDCICADGSKGYAEEAPFDKILVSASAETAPRAWKEQLKIGGRIVAPIGSSIWLFIKKGETKFEEYEYPGFAFVPLINR
ncbi:MAG: protein-L-isoaspartate O-methyltransferase [Candidatus Nealsonbacteria bacterium]|nr:protein-L-isoaspartate O-methyltransferase [Candidatus Nealsonbacteria bacterium]